MPSVGTKTRQGRCITQRASRAQRLSGGGTPGSGGGRRSRLRTESAPSRGPRTASTAGSRVSAASTAMPTTIAPATPTERRIMKSNRTSPIRPSRTVKPLKKMARPAVATVTPTASSTAARSIDPSARRPPPRRPSSSRKRLVSNSE